MAYLSPIEDRLMASVRYDAVNGSADERRVCGLQMMEAAQEIKRLRNRIRELEEQIEGLRAHVKDLSTHAFQRIID